MLHIVSNGLGLEEGVSIFNPGTGNVIGRVCWGVAALYVCCRFVLPDSPSRLQPGSWATT